MLYKTKNNKDELLLYLIISFFYSEIGYIWDIQKFLTCLWPYEIFDANQNLHSILSTFVYLLNAKSVKLNKINNDLDVF